MDMSKLPKLSQTPAPPAAEESAAAPENASAPVEPRRVVEYRTPVDPGFSVGEIWFSLIVGVIFLLLGRSFGGYALAKVTGQPHHTGVVWSPGTPLAGQEVSYRELQGNVFLNDSAMFLVGLAIVLDAIVRVAVYKGIRAARLLAYLGFAITVLATIYNLYAVSVLLKGNVLPLLSLLAVAMGGYISFQQWQTIQMMKQKPAY